MALDQLTSGINSLCLVPGCNIKLLKFLVTTCAVLGGPSGLQFCVPYLYTKLLFGYKNFREKNPHKKTVIFGQSRISPKMGPLG